MCFDANSWIATRAWISKRARRPSYGVRKRVSFDTNLHDFSLIWLLIVADESPAVTSGSAGL
jgi:hypothetical protein